MPVGAIAGSAVIGAGSSIIAGNKAANAQKNAADQASATERYMYDTTRSDYAPYREVGYNTLGKLAGLYGVGGGPGGGSVDWGAYVKGNPDALANWNAIKGTPNDTFGGDIAKFGQYHYGDDGSRRDLTPFTSGGTTSGDGQYGDFFTSPGYQFRMDEGQKAIERSSAARGLRMSGATLKSLTRFAQGTASDEFNNYANRLAALAGVGQSATGSTAAAGASAANGIAQNQIAAGNARASSYANTGSAINNGVNNLASLYLYQNQGGFKQPQLPGVTMT